ncbi:hypothetical protein ACQKK5_01770 [Brevibacillus panacihumi]|uniref:hypothetical protein n=1 Tax=Brevibacillus panacihumi TaxID=497735 RepID=UPI003CFBD97E
MSFSRIFTGSPAVIRPITYCDEPYLGLEFLSTEGIDDQEKIINSISVTYTILLTLEQWQNLSAAVEASGDTTFYKVKLKGSIISNLPKDMFDGGTAVVCHNISYIGSHKRSPLVIELHNRFDGVCQFCSQRCDKQAVFISLIDDEKGIVCPDCYHGRTNPNFFIRDSIAEKIGTQLDLPVEEVKNYLCNFPNRYALVYVNDNSRKYWSWNPDEYIRQMVVQSSGEITRVIYRKDIQQTCKRATIIKKWKMNVKGIQVTPPAHIDRDKIEFHKDYYQDKQTFIRPVRVIMGSDGLQLIHGYHIFKAAEELGVPYLLIHLVDDTSETKHQIHPLNSVVPSFFMLTRNNEFHLICKLDYWKNGVIARQQYAQFLVTRDIDCMTSSLHSLNGSLSTNNTSSLPLSGFYVESTIGKKNQIRYSINYQKCTASKRREKLVVYFQNAEEIDSFHRIAIYSISTLLSQIPNSSDVVSI